MYKLNTHTGATIRFATMGAVLHHLNSEWPHGENPYLGNAQKMHLDLVGVIYPIVQKCGMAGLAPSFEHDIGSAYERISQWLDEVLVYAKDEMGATKPPHLMTRGQWLSITALASVAFGSAPMFSGTQLFGHHQEGEREYTSLSHYYDVIFLERFGYGHNGPCYDGFQTNSRHEVHVAYALARGEAIPEEILAGYRSHRFSSDAIWFGEVVRKPFLRGRFKSVSHLSALVNLLREQKLELTVENTPEFVEALEPLAPTAERVQVDDVLYRKGVLRLRPQHPLPTPEEIGKPYNEFAEKLRLLLAAWKRELDDKVLEDRRATGRLTEREYDWAKLYNASWPDRETFAWANRVAAAVAERNLPGLLTILDGAGNETSKKAVEQEYGVRLRNLSAAKRRRAIFALAGFVDDDAFKVEEDRLAQEQKVRKAERELQDARKRALEFTISIDKDSPMTCAAYVEHLVERGHVDIVSTKKGAATLYYLTNPQTREGYPLRRPNGTLDYARLMVEKQPA